MAIKKTTHEGRANTETCPTLIEFVLDETGSMSDCLSAVIEGYNAFLSEQRALGTSCQVTLTKFDTGGLKTPYTDLDVNMVPPLTRNTYLPGHSTNLYDAICTRAADVAVRTAGFTVKPNVVIVVMTDGHENGSRTYSANSVREMIAKQSQEGVTFVYMGSTADATSIGRSLGFPEGNIKQFSASETRETFTKLAAATTAYRSTRGATATTETNYFSAAQN
jgi:hypothetical protein